MPIVRVNVVVEGQTEEAFVKDVLAPHFARLNVFLSPIVVPNKRGATARANRGGLARFGTALDFIQRTLKSDSAAFCTTLFDYYGLPSDFPGLRDAPPPARLNDRVEFLEDALDAATGRTRRLIPHLQVHEFEALLLTDLEVVEKIASPVGRVSSQPRDELRAAVAAAASPEAINEGPTTAPSKRLLAAYPGYDKVLFGPLIAHDIGLERLREACPRFGAWIGKLEALARA
jgi:hypothetical protein